MQRKLAAILSADVVGYSKMMEEDEAGTLERLKANRRTIFDPTVAAHGGRIVKLMGDGALVEFASVVSAVKCAIELQSAIEKLGGEPPHIRYRIGVNLGDVLVEGDDLYGEGVNVAARLQALADPGCVAVSRVVRDQVAGRVPREFVDIGEHVVKHNEKPVHVFTLNCGRNTPRKTAAGAAAPRDAEISICVLPFANMSGDPEQEYFSDGVTEDIITDLSKVSSLAVVSRNTAFTFKGKHVDVGNVARQLKVSHILEGSVRKAGNRVRITAQLIEGTSDSHIWADRFDRDLNDIFAVQDEISEAIVKALKLKLMPGEKKAIEARSTSNPRAYKFYLMARQFHNLGQSRHRPIVTRLARRAAEIDPSYARAWALLAISQSNIRLLTGGYKDTGWDAAEKALSLDPSLAEAHGARGRILADAGKYEEAWAEHEVALGLDPESFEVVTNAGRCLMSMGRNNEAAALLERAAEINPNDVWALGMAIQCYEAAGDRDGMLDVARRCLERVEKIIAAEPDHTIAISFGITSLSALGERERALEWAERSELIDPDDINLLYNNACSMVTLREFDMALRYLEKSFEGAVEQNLHWFRADSSLDAIRGDLRFQKSLGTIARRLGLPLVKGEV